MNPGRVVEYFDNDRIVCGLIVESKGNRLRLLTEEDREATLSPNRVLHCSSYSINVGVPRQERVRKLKEIVAKQENLKKKIETREIWELLQGTKETVDDQLLTEVVFGKETTSDHIAALWRSIFEDRLHFKIKGKQFLIHTPEQVAHLKLKREREAERERELEEASRWFRATWEGKEAVKPRKADHYIGLLKEHAVFGKEAPSYPQIQETLSRAGLTAQDASFRLLVKTGVWDEDENLLLHRYQISTDWSEELLGEAQAIASGSNVKGEKRRDLTRLSTFSIDSESARDIDDALSFERVENGFRVGIHITDVAHFIPLDSLLNEEASERLTSIYLPEGKIPMLPPLLSENILSLLPGEERLAVSMFVHLDEGGEVRASETFLSRIKIHRRLTYEEVDALVSRDASFRDLHRLAEQLKEKRRKSGALILSLPEITIKVNDEKEITLLRRERDTPSQIIVSELMILANYLAACFLQERGIPAIYRSQGEPREAVEQRSEHDLVAGYRQRKVLSRAELTTVAKRHHGLGLEAYTTASSPIRRYVDLVVQRQLTAALNPKLEGYMEGEIERIIYETEEAQGKVIQVEDQRKRYWLLKALQDKVNERVPAIVLDHFFNRCTLLLKEYLLEVNLPAVQEERLASGKEVDVVVEQVEPFWGTVRVRLAH